MSQNQIKESAPGASTRPICGPWIVADECAGGYAISAQGIGETEYFSTIAIAIQRDNNPIHGGGITAGEALANARLMAAAPMLYDALRRLNASNRGNADEHETGCRCPVHEADWALGLCDQAPGFLR